MDDEPFAEWDRRVPALVDEVAARWSLEVGPAYDGSNVAWVAPAVRDGEPVVLKLQWPHPECEHEAAALEAWAGHGAVQLLDHDVDRHALLLERATPGTHLATAGIPDPLAVLAGLLPRLWVPVAPPFTSLVDEASGWAERLVANWEAAGRPCERRLVDAARGLIGELVASSPAEAVLLHQDLHGDNVLAAEREPWLVIDPKPLAGERAFSVAPIVRSFELGHGRGAVVGRLDRLCDELDLDRECALGWTVAQTVAWSFDTEHGRRHHDTARWLLDVS